MKELEVIDLHVVSITQKNRFATYHQYQCVAEVLKGEDEYLLALLIKTKKPKKKLITRREIPLHKHNSLAYYLLCSKNHILVLKIRNLKFLRLS